MQLCRLCTRTGGGSRDIGRHPQLLIVYYVESIADTEEEDVSAITRTGASYLKKPHPLLLPSLPNSRLWMEGDDTDPTLAAVAPITNSPPHGQPRAKSHKTAYLSSALYKVRRSALRTMDAEALIYWGTQFADLEPRDVAAFSTACRDGGLDGASLCDSSSGMLREVYGLRAQGAARLLVAMRDYRLLGAASSAKLTKTLSCELLAAIASLLSVSELGILARVSRQFVTPSIAASADEFTTGEHPRTIIDEAARLQCHTLGLCKRMMRLHLVRLREQGSAAPWLRVLWLVPTPNVVRRYSRKEGQSDLHCEELEQLLFDDHHHFEARPQKRGLAEPGAIYREDSYRPRRTGWRYSGKNTESMRQCPESTRWLRGRRGEVETTHGLCSFTSYTVTDASGASEESKVLFVVGTNKHAVPSAVSESEFPADDWFHGLETWMP